MKNILIVEDDTSIRELLVEILEIEGFNVSASENGAEGLKSLETSIPDLILMDLMMPIMDGFSFRKQLLANSDWDSIPLIAMSAQNQSVEKLADNSIFNFINKPLQIDHLLETIKSL